MLYHLILSLPMMVCLFWAGFFATRCVVGKTEPRVNITAMAFFVAATALYWDHWLYYTSELGFAGEWTYVILNLCVYPLFYMYLRDLVRTRDGRDAPWLLLPAAIVAVVYPLNELFGWQGEKAIELFARLSFGVQVVWVWVRGYQLLRNARRRMDDTYSDYRSFLLKPVNVMLQLFGFTAVVSMVLNVFGRAFFADRELAGIPAVIMAALLYGLGYVAAETVVPPEEVAEKAEQTYKSNPADVAESSDMPDQPDRLMRKIDQVMRERKLYCNSSLTILDLASAVHSNRTYVSNCINRNCGQSFSQYVATFRVARAKEILANPRYHSDHDAITDAITQSGFLTDQTFYRVFRETTGTTPLQYRQKALNG